MTESRWKELLGKYEKGKCSEPERELLHHFFDRLQSQEDIWQRLGLSEKDRIRLELFMAVHRKIRKAERSALLLKTMRRAAVWLLLAIGLGGVGFYFQSNLPEREIARVIKKHTEKGQKLTVRLPDGSTVRLNSESSLTYPSVFSATREMELTGEAFFEVQKNPERPFIVKSGDINTTVLGTSFNVSAYPDQKDIKVTVATGKVKVDTRGRSLELSPGEEATYQLSSKQLIATEADLSRSLAWKNGTLVFEGNTLKEVTRQLSRWYGVDIALRTSGDSTCELEMTFDDLSLTEVLDQLEIVTGVRYQFVTDYQVEIIGNACQN